MANTFDTLPPSQPDEPPPLQVHCADGTTPAVAAGLAAGGGGCSAAGGDTPAAAGCSWTDCPGGTSAAGPRPAPPTPAPDDARAGSPGPTSASTPRDRT